MGPRVLLINPGKTFESENRIVYPPLGCLCVAAMVREAGYSVQIVDYDRMPVDADRVRADLERFSPDVVGVSVLTGPQLERAVVISDVAHESGCRVVWGGPHPTILPRESLRHPSVDAVVLGEGEEAMVRLLRHFEKPRRGETLYGCGILERGEPVVFPPAPALAEMDDLPMPAWDLLPDVDRYMSLLGEDLRVGDRPRMKMNTSRSCVYKCSFCYQANDAVIGYLGKYRALSPARVIREMEFVQDLVSTDIGAWDFVDMLTIFRRREAAELADAIAGSGLDIRWYGSGRHAILTEELIRRLHRSGFERIFFGVESGSPRMLKMIRKPLDVPLCERITRYLNRVGIDSIASYIMGFPTEGIGEALQTLQVMNRLPHSVSVVNVYLPIPGTPTFEASVATGRFECPTDTLEWCDFVERVETVNVSEIPSEELYPMVYETMRRKYLDYYLRYQWQNLRRGKLGTFYRALRKNVVNETIFSAA